jgi:hypothetical protein
VHSKGDVSTKLSWEWFHRHIWVFVAYVFATWFTTPPHMGDTAYYVDSILLFIESGRYSYGLTADASFHNFVEFGHLLWRPIGWLLFEIFGPLTTLVREDLRDHVTALLVATNWLSGLLTILLLNGLLTQFCGRKWITNLAAVGFIFSQAFLLYTQTGCSYIPGLSLLVLALYVLIMNGQNREVGFWPEIVAGVSLAGAVALWVPYVLVVPAVLVSPIVLFNVDKSRLRLVLQAFLVFVVAVSSAYIVAAVLIGISDIQDFKAWVIASSHGLVGGGISRTVFGFFGSFMHASSDGIMFKRFLLNDPYNPVSVVDLFQTSLGEMFLFYLFLASILFNSSQSPHGRKFLIILSTSAIPILLFALFWEGGTIERYLPLYPMLFLMFSSSLCESCSSWTFVHRFIGFSFVAIAIVANLAAMSKSLGERQQQVAAKMVVRTQDLQPRFHPGSRVALFPMDELSRFAGDFPSHWISLSLRPYPIVALLTVDSSKWREKFADAVLSVWGEGGDMWISRRVFSSRPRSDWNWVEGVDPNISWEDIRTFFSQLDVDKPVGGEDGFVLLLQSLRNEAILKSLR